MSLGTELCANPRLLWRTVCARAPRHHRHRKAQEGTVVNSATRASLGTHGAPQVSNAHGLLPICLPGSPREPCFYCVLDHFKISEDLLLGTGHTDPGRKLSVPGAPSSTSFGSTCLSVKQVIHEHRCHIPLPKPFPVGSTDPRNDPHFLTSQGVNHGTHYC